MFGSVNTLDRCEGFQRVVQQIVVRISAHNFPAPSQPPQSRSESVKVAEFVFDFQQRPEAKDGGSVDRCELPIGKTGRWASRTNLCADTGQVQHHSYRPVFPINRRYGTWQGTLPFCGCKLCRLADRRPPPRHSHRCATRLHAAERLARLGL